MHVPLHEEHITWRGTHAQDQRQIAGRTPADKKKRLLRAKHLCGPLLRLQNDTLRMMQIIGSRNFSRVDLHDLKQRFVRLTVLHILKGLSVLMARYVEGSVFFLFISQQRLGQRSLIHTDSTPLSKSLNSIRLVYRFILPLMS
ncbi:hypothetical protein D3C76_1257050 [compost metagenome]